MPTKVFMIEIRGAQATQSSLNSVPESHMCLTVVVCSSLRLLLRLHFFLSFFLLSIFFLFSRDEATLKQRLSVRPSVRPSVRLSVRLYVFWLITHYF